MKVEITEPRHVVGYGSYKPGEKPDLPKEVAEQGIYQGWAVKPTAEPKPTMTKENNDGE